MSLKPPLTDINNILYYPIVERLPLIAFVGPEGSGKSTQAKLLAQKFDLPYISTGDMIRDAAQNDFSRLGDAARDMFEKHNYLPGPLLLKIVANRFQKKDAERGLVLDGGFRTLEETKDFAGMLADIGKDFSVKVVYLRMPAWKSLERTSEGKRNRTDDKPEAVISRLKSFYTNLPERMSYIKENWDFSIILVGNKSIEEINGEVLKKIV